MTDGTSAFVSPTRARSALVDAMDGLDGGARYVGRHGLDVEDRVKLQEMQTKLQHAWE